MTKLLKSGDGNTVTEEEEEVEELVKLSALEYEPSGNLAEVVIEGERRALQVSAPLLPSGLLKLFYSASSHDFVRLKSFTRYTETMRWACSG